MNPSVTERDPTARAPSVDRTVIPRLEIGLAALLSLAWIIFRIRFFLHAGALWRDEVNSVDLSTSPQISDIWHNLQYDSFPMLWHLLLRYWIRSGIGASDRGIRLLGLLAGLGILPPSSSTPAASRPNPSSPSRSWGLAPPSFATADPSAATDWE